LNRSKIPEVPVLRSYSYAQQSWDFFHFLEIVTGWLVRRLANFLINIKIYNKLTLKIMKTLSFTKNKIKKIELEIYE